MKAIAMGVHVLDVLVRPVEAIPEGQGGQLVEEIRITRRRAPPAAPRSSLAKLGAEVRSAGAIGTDAVGDMLRRPARARRRRHLAAGAPRRRADLGQRAADPARTATARRSTWSAPTRTYGPGDVDWDAVDGGHAPAPRRRPSSWAARRPREISSRAREHGVDDLGRHPRARATRACSSGSPPRSRTSTTCCPTTSRCSASPARRRRGRLPRAGRARRRLRGRDVRRRRRRGRRRRRRRARAGVRDRRRSTRPAAATPSPPASCAGSSLGRARRDAAVLGCAAAALVAQGLGHRPRRLRPRRRGRAREQRPDALGGGGAGQLARIAARSRREQVGALLARAERDRALAAPIASVTRSVRASACA